MISIIVACSKNGVIGKDNQLPWNLTQDLKLFKERTIGHPLIMGRKTWESLPVRCLKDRLNIVITSKPEEYTKECQYSNRCHGILFFTNSLSKAIFIAEKNMPGKEIFIIGGQQVYETSLQMNVVDKIYMSKISQVFDGDKYFPDLKNDWVIDTIKMYDDFDLIEYEKKENLVAARIAI